MTSNDFEPSAQPTAHEIKPERSRSPEQGLVPERELVHERRMHYVSRFVWFMRFLGLFYAAFAVFLFLFPQELFYLINVGPKVFKVTEAIPDPSEKFFIVFATAHFAILAGLSWFSATYPFIRGFVVVHLLAKVVTCYTFVYLFMNEQRYFAYAIGAASDLLIGLLVLWTAAFVRSDQTSATKRF